jgi:hypothetical protein
LALRAIQVAIVAVNAAGPNFSAIVDDLLRIKLTTARLIDALRESAA